MRLFLIFPALLSVALTFPIQYEMFDGHKVLSIIPTTKEHLKQIYAIESKGIYVDFWLEPRQVGKPVHMRVTPEQYDIVISYLKERGMEHSIHVENVRNLIERELTELKDRVPFKVGNHPSKITLDQYHNLDDILAYLASVVTTYPNLASLVNIGSSTQNRALRAIKIGSPGVNKPAIWIDGGIHAREWVTTATIVWIINELTTNAQYATLLGQVDFYLMPVVNADGYSFTWTDNRLWRKTRSGPRNGNCYGVDPNRNWNMQWGVAGASNDPCSDIYDGPSPFSEPEPKSVADFLTANKANMKAYFNLHSYSQDWMYPFGYAANTYPADVQKLRALSAQAVAAIRSVNGLNFQYGSIVDVVYPASGGTIDWTNAVCGIDYSFAMEMRPDGNNPNGFVLPPTQIIAAATEAWAGIMVVVNAVASGQ